MQGARRAAGEKRERIDGGLTEYKGISDIPGTLGDLITMSIKNNTDSVVSGEGESRRIVGGNATERAVLAFAMDAAKVFDAPKISSIP